MHVTSSDLVPYQVPSLCCVRKSLGALPLPWVSYCSFFLFFFFFSSLSVLVLLAERLPHPRPDSNDGCALMEQLGDVRGGKSELGVCM